MAGIFGLLMSGAGVIKDQYYNLTSLLLPGNGTNGKQNNAFLDSSGQNGGAGWTITPNGNATQGTFSPFSQTGWGNYFGTTGNYLSVADNAALRIGTQDFWIEAWVYVTSFASVNTIAIKRVYNTTGTGTWFFGIDTNGAVDFDQIQTGATIITTNNNAISLNTWTHVAVSRDSSDVWRIFINGNSSGTTSPTNNFDFSTTEPLVIGNVRDSSNISFNGYISNLRFGIGSPNYTSNFIPSTTPLTNITNTQLLTCQSNRFLDNSSNAFTISTSGSPSVVAFSPFAPTQAYSAASVGGSGYFDGNSDFLQLADNTSLRLGTSAYTVEFWWYPVSSAAAQVFMAKAATGDGAPQAYYAWSTGRFYWYSGTTDIFSTSYTVALNQWYHVAFVRTSTSSNDTRFYINGSLVATSTDATDYTNTAVLNIGGQGGGTFCVNGYLSNFRLVKGTAITPPSGGPTAPLTAVSGTSLLLNFTNAGVVDATAKNVLETVGNAQISTTQSKWGGGSLYFDGTGDFLQLPASNIYAFGTGDYTVETWVRFTSITTTLQIIFESGSTGGNSFYFHVDVDQISVGTSAAYVSNQATTFTTDQWYHIAACRSNGTLRLYKDGAQVGSSVTDSTNWTSSGSARIGANFASGQTLFGYLDDLRISRFARYTGSTYTVPTAPFPVQ